MAKLPEGVALFAERQWMPSWITAVLVGSDLFPVFLLYYTAPGQRGLLLAVVAALVLLTWVPILLLFAVLDTRVETAGVEVRFGLAGWIHFRFARAEIQWAERRTYRPIAEFGGWGIRGFGAKRALNISGRDGVELGLLRRGKPGTTLIGSQRAGELETALRLLGFPGRT